MITCTNKGSQYNMERERTFFFKSPSGQFVEVEIVDVYFGSKNRSVSAKPGNEPFIMVRALEGSMKNMYMIIEDEKLLRDKPAADTPGESN
jgi:hypothetical protein